MRTLTSNASTQADLAMGAEPVAVIKVEWGGSVGTRYYAGAQKTVGTIVTRPQLLDVSGLSWQMKQFQSGSVSSFTVRLDDSEGDIKEILSSMVVENRAASILLHFEGNDEADLVTMVKGKLVSPIEWGEGDRIMTFTVESFVTESEVGYAPTEFQFPTLPKESDGKMWPICFGSPILVPAVRVQKRATSVLMRAFNLTFQVDTNGDLITNGDASLYVEDGSDFPQSTICALNVGGIVFKGFFSGSTFSITNLSEGVHLPKFVGVNFASRQNDGDQNNASVAWMLSYIPVVGHYMLLHPTTFGGAGSAKTYKIVKQQGRKIWFHEDVIDDVGNKVLTASSAFPGEVAYVPRYGWPNSPEWELPEGHTWMKDDTRGIIGLQWNFSAGTKVIVWEDYSTLFTQSYGDIWVCNGIPNTAIVSVFAQKEGQLAPVSSEFYQKWTSVTIPLFGQTVSAIYMPYALSELPEQGWEDQLYVTMQSSQGPNVADVLKYLLDNYSEFDTDAASFSDVQALVAAYPVNFAIQEKKSTLELCEEIAWQARCALVYAGDAVKIRYISKQPDADATIAEANLLQDSVRLKFTPAEDVVTRFVAEWRQNFYQPDPWLVAYENNVAAFGMREQRFQFYIYNTLSLVQKSASFWATRLGNSWQLASFTAFMERAKMEPQDCLSLELDDESIFNVSEVKSVVQSQDYDFKGCTVSFEVWLPRIAGSNTVHAQAWQDDSGDVAPDSPYLVWSESSPMMTAQLPKRGPRLAKILRAREESDGDVPWKYLLNVYENGYDQPPTQVGVPAKEMDEDAEEIQPDKPVTTTPTASGDYVQPATPVGIVLATISSEVGAGVYNWTKLFGSGPESGTARELNLSTGINAGTKVVLHYANKTEGYFFFFPVEDC